MIKYFSEKLHYHYHNPNYLYFMVSLFLLIVLPPIASCFQYGNILFNVTYGIVILMAVLYTTSSNRELMAYSVLGVVIFLSFIQRDLNAIFSILTAILTLVFFALVFMSVVRFVLQLKEITANAVFASVSGYLILGIVSAPLFYIIEETFNNAFQLPESTEFYDYMYYGFITLTTVGFGDISPIHPIAKSFTLLISIIGQLYLTILVAIIIGKYLAAEALK